MKFTERKWEEQTIQERKSWLDTKTFQEMPLHFLLSIKMNTGSAKNNYLKNCRKGKIVALLPSELQIKLVSLEVNLCRQN